MINQPAVMQAIEMLDVASRSNEPTNVDSSLGALLMALGDTHYTPNHMLRDRLLFAIAQHLWPKEPT